MRAHVCRIEPLSQPSGYPESVRVCCEGGSGLQLARGTTTTWSADAFRGGVTLLRKHPYARLQWH
eukprot:502879-Amphidinium_carterae.1